METLHDNSEAVDNNAADDVTEFAPFDPEAAEKARAEWRAEHPDAVDDVEKARAMAEAGDKMRTLAANSRKDAKFWRELDENHNDPTAKMLAGHAASDAEFFDQSADTSERIEEQLYNNRKN